MAEMPGVPRSTSRALDQLGRPEICSHQVKVALRNWRWFTRIPLGPPTWERDPYEDEVGFTARATLEAAIWALNRREAKPLRDLVDRVDAAFYAATVNDPFTALARPWWERRQWH